MPCAALWRSLDGAVRPLVAKGRNQEVVVSVEEKKGGWRLKKIEVVGQVETLSAAPRKRKLRMAH